MYMVCFQSGIGDARQCELCPSPGETTEEMGSESMLDCSMYLTQFSIIYLSIEINS